MRRPAFFVLLALGLAGVAPTARADLLVLNAAGASSYVKRFDAVSGAPIAIFGYETEDYYSMNLSPFGELCVASNVLGYYTLQSFNGGDQYTGGLLGNSSGVMGGLRGPDNALYAIGAQDGSFQKLGVYRAIAPAATLFIPNGAGGMTAPTGFLFGPDRNLYVSDSALGVLRFSGADGTPLGTFVPLGRGGLQDVTKMLFGPDGRLYVASVRANAVLRFDGSSGAFVDIFVTSGSGGLGNPRGLAFDPDGNLCVTSRASHQVLRYNGASGAFLNVAAAIAADPADPRTQLADIVFDRAVRLTETTWFDDAPPAGAVTGTSSGTDWTWVTSSPPPMSGTRAHRANAAAGAAALQEHYFNFASEALAVGAGDWLFAYIYLTGSPNAQTEIMLSWCDGTWEHRAYWGADSINLGANGTASRRYMGVLPHTDGWYRLAVPAALLGLEGGNVQGMAFSIFNGAATFDRVGKLTRVAATADHTPPTVQITTPASGAAVSRLITVQAKATDNDVVRTVRLAVDGAPALYLDHFTGSDYSHSWDTTTVANGSHVLTVVAEDAAGNQATSSPVTVTVSNATSTGTDTIWFDDSLPAGAVASASGGDAWTWVASNPAPASGSQAHQSSIAGALHEHAFDWANSGALNLAAGDSLFAYVYLDPANPPREIMLSWRDSSSWEHRAYWGANLITYGEDGTSSRIRIGDLPPPGTWTKLVVPASKVGLGAAALYGMSFSVFDGRATWDAAGKTGTATAGDTSPPGVYVTFPTAGSTVSGTIAVGASGTDNVGVTAISFAIDGAIIGTDTEAPFAATWNTSAVSNGSHVVTAIARDAAGNQTTSSGVTVQVSNAASVPTDTVWLDDDIPAGAVAGASGGDAWNWIATSPAPVSGSRSHQSSIASATHEHFFGGATTAFTVDSGDTLVAYVFLDPANPPRELILSWFAGNWEHRAYWGENLITYGTNQTESRFPFGALPPAGQWVRLEIPAHAINITGTTGITGMSFGLYGGRAAWDRVGKHSSGITTGDGAPPTAALLQPTPGAVLSGRVSGQMRFTDNVSIRRVALLVDGQAVDASNWNQPVLGLGFLWDTTTVANGSHALSAQAWDAAGNTMVSTAAVVTVNNSTAPPPSGDTTAPSVTLTAPADNATVSGNVTLTASASDNVGVAAVQFRVDGASVGSSSSAPFAFIWNSASVANGSHALTAVASDAAGNSATSAAAIVSVNNAAAGAVIWIDGAVPPNAAAAASGGDGWTWVTSNPSPFAAARVHQSAIATGLHDHSFVGTTSPLQVGTGDTLFAYVYLDPANMPREIMLSFNDGTWEHRAYWGGNEIPYGQDGTASRRNIGPLPAAGQWVRLEVAARLVGLEGRAVNGMSFSLVAGRASWDIAGKVSP